MTETTSHLGLRGATPGPRLIAVDWLRTAAFLAMAIFHFGRDFEVLGLVPPGTTFGGLWDLSARAIASSFLFLAGLSLWLAHGRRFRARGYLKRLGILILAASGVSVATRLAVPEAWVRFGILHSIALAGLFGLLFLRMPFWVTGAAAIAILWLGPTLRDPAFNEWWWLWSGLGTSVPVMIDYEPMVPFLAPLLLGLAFGQAGGASWLGWGPARPGWLAEALAWPGRHALSLYLIHQPVLIATIWAGTWIWGRI
ncbi:putative membrane protein [Jannaschia seosinensis]|uniref:Putative membrane protein n=1 Tax=Jannaschia seosinensis TaxID=313367 RepID=A0A0M7BE03_9RHOB|nr:heparan-alpha-glucosaminide N-acetyltransferase [Jannaschia seosinensis]CUH40308.1 putative membrane protein [Jannaschia seosinensis]